MPDVQTRLAQAWEWRTLPDGTSQRILPHAVGLALAQSLGLHPGDLDRAALARDILPERYLRQLHGISLADQRRLCHARVAQVGLGGLGGYVLEQLARAGVGFLRAADGDVFEPSNLNRQLLSANAFVGRPKTEAALDRVARINPAVRLEAWPRMLDEAGMAELLQGTELVVDALGGLDDRPALRRAARAAGIPLVTAAVAGSTGYVAVAWPDREGVSDLLARGGAGAENSLGTPAWTVAVAASLQANLAVRCLLGLAGEDTPALVFDLADGSFTPVRL
ncbi:ThiF family adenylyltransferase [Megalodesulfovibrio gigas]|uniref:Putative UBA/THIF-type NAD/FAD binding protein n=1 Tax=Megalodesulfovibrio gigas (strain ATCC 19364 / DSM 1382 / NCIMB 9332 / VKM B-1759) TaxID=1121448 RepID=T2GEV5_MEGG1|nr:ThiF family adenylyltransferase [Megalodesulfovibrio gigas]AGW14462.1 putative UBA/THIF-type NAD/FAD binding protein [Megalodesulfovibrio gigas DSM 1382 = ATCC 19364]